MGRAAGRTMWGWCCTGGWKEGERGVQAHRLLLTWVMWVWSRLVAADVSTL